jgi:transposase
MSQRDFPPIMESAEQLRDLLTYEQSAKRRSRLHLLFLIRSGEVQSREEAAARLLVHRNSVWAWLEAYKAGGLEQMLRIGTPGPKPVQKSLPAPVFNALEKQVEGEGFSGYTHAQEWLRTEYGRDLPYSTVHKLVRYRLGAKLKRARPRHQKKRQ